MTDGEKLALVLDDLTFLTMKPFTAKQIFWCKCFFASTMLWPIPA